jgi:hypothetical protein
MNREAVIDCLEKNGFRKGEDTLKARCRPLVGGGKIVDYRVVLPNGQVRDDIRFTKYMLPAGEASRGLRVNKGYFGETVVENQASLVVRYSGKVEQTVHARSEDIWVEQHYGKGDVVQWIAGPLAPAIIFGYADPAYQEDFGTEE